MKTTILEDHCSQLMEHFDSVLILVTSHDSKDGSTAFDWRGKGNMFANAGAVQAWLTRDDEISRKSVKNNEQDE